jgi:hypothetical protein
VLVSGVGWCRSDGFQATVEAAAVVVMVLTEVFVFGARRYLYENECSSLYDAKKKDSRRKCVPE